MSTASTTPNATARSKPRVIEPPVDLRSRVRVIGSGPMSEDPIEKADRALAQLSAQFGSWMDQELGRLLAARDRARREGLAGPVGEALFSAAHDIKGEGATLGFPIAGEIAATLCALLLSGRSAELPFRLLDLHVEAIRAIVRQDIRDAEHPVGSAMARELHDAAMVLLQRLETPVDAADPAPGGDKTAA